MPLPALLFHADTSLRHAVYFRRRIVAAIAITPAAMPRHSRHTLVNAAEISLMPHAAAAIDVAVKPIH